MHRKVSSEEKRRVKIDLCDIRVSQICLSVRLSVCESVTFWGFLSCVLATRRYPFFAYFVSQTRGELPASFHPLLLWKKYASSRVLAYCGSFHHVTNVISKKTKRVTSS